MKNLVTLTHLKNRARGRKEEGCYQCADARNQWMTMGLGWPAATIYKTELQESEARVTSAGKCEEICSYNWADSDEATMFVPGTVASISASVSIFLPFPPCFDPGANRRKKLWTTVSKREN